MVQTDRSDREIGAVQRWIYAFPGLPHAFVAMPLNIVIPAYYAQHTAVTLGQIAAATTLTRVLDAFCDPMIGVLSDRTRSPLGRRKPWVLAGALVCAISIFFMFRPPADAGVIYYGAWSFLLYVGFSLFEIPRGAWTAELSRDYEQRNRIQASLATLSIIGCLVFWLTPLLLSQLTGTTAITGTALSGIAWLYLLLMPAGVLLAVWRVPNGFNPVEAMPSLKDFFRAIVGNRPLWLFLAIKLFWGLGQGAFLSTMLIFVTDYMGKAEFFPVIMIVYFAVQIFILPLWLRIFARIGKHKAWVIGMMGDALTAPLLLLVPTGNSVGAIAGLIAMIVVSAIFAAPGTAVPGAMLGDVIDYDLFRTRVNKAGKFTAFYVLLIKIAMALGAGLAFAILDLADYRVGSANGTFANNTLIFVFFVLPALCWAISSAILWFFPITKRRQEAIRRRIERRRPEEADQAQEQMLPGQERRCNV